MNLQMEAEKLDCTQRKPEMAAQPHKSVPPEDGFLFDDFEIALLEAICSPQPPDRHILAKDIFGDETHTDSVDFLAQSLKSKNVKLKRVNNHYEFNLPPEISRIFQGEVEIEQDCSRPQAVQHENQKKTPRVIDNMPTVHETRVKLDEKDYPCQSEQHGSFRPSPKNPYRRHPEKSRPKDRHTGNLTPMQRPILEYIKNAGRPVAKRELMEIFNLGKNSATMHLHYMTKNGYLNRVQAESGSRAVLYLPFSR